MTGVNSEAKVQTPPPLLQGCPPWQYEEECVQLGGFFHKANLEFAMCAFNIRIVKIKEYFLILQTIYIWEV